MALKIIEINPGCKKEDDLESGKRPSLAQEPLRGRVLKVICVIDGFPPGWDLGMKPLDRELHLAAQENDTLRMEELIRAGADVNAKDRNGRTPLYRASLDGNYPHWGGAALLKKHGATE